MTIGPQTQSSPSDVSNKERLLVTLAAAALLGLYVHGLSHLFGQAKENYLKNKTAAEKKVTKDIQPVKLAPRP